jgi:hypothetical protein
MASPQLGTAAVWTAWRRLYPIYQNLARELVIDVEPCVDLDANQETPAADALVQAAKWFATMDGRIHAHHLRHFAQTSPLMTEEAISDLLIHSLNKAQRTESDRDKIDFLLVQLVAMRMPPGSGESDFTLDSTAKLLEPVIGGVTGAPEFTADLDQLVAEGNRAKTLNLFFTSRILERSREIKLSSGGAFFQPMAMAAFARFGLRLRRRFFELIQQDLNAILEGLRDLESRGVQIIDCRKAQFSAEEPIVRIRMICQSWRVMFQAEYSAGQPLCLLVDLKTAVEATLAQTAKSLPDREPIKTAAASGAAGRTARQ